MEGVTIDLADAGVDIESIDSLLTGTEEQFTEEAYKLYRTISIQRLRNKRNELREEEIKESEMEFKQLHMSRDKWISNLKMKRELDLKSSVSRATVLKALIDYPQIFDKNGRTYLQKEWDEIVPDAYEPDVHSAVESANPVLHLVPAAAPDDEADLDPNEENKIPQSTGGYPSSALIGNIGVEGVNTVVTAAYLRHTMAPAVRSHRPSPMNRQSSLQAVGMLSKYSERRHSFGERSDVPSHKKDKSPTHKMSSKSGLDSTHSESRMSSPDKGIEAPASLIDSMLLVGPSKREVDAFLDHICNELSAQEATAEAQVLSPVDTSYQSGGGLNSSIAGGGPRPVSTPGRARSSSNSSTNTLNSISHNVVPAIVKQTRNISPDIIFVTSQDPDVEMDALVSFCFPSGVETTVSGSPVSSVLMNSFPGGSYSKASLRSIGRSSMPPSGYGTMDNSATSTQTAAPPFPLSVSSASAGISNRSVFLLTNHHSSQFGICLSVPRVIFSTYRDKTFVIKTSYSLCIITPFPFFGFFFHVLAEFINMRGLLQDTSGVVGRQEPGDPIKAELRQLESFAMKLLRQMAPKPGITLDFSVSVNMAHRDVPLKRLNLQNFDEEVSIGTLQWALPILLKSIPLDQILLVLGCALTEMKIVIRAANLETLSGCVLALVYLLRPLHWAGPIISILPAIMHDILDSPVPVFIGVESTPKSFKMTNGLIVVDPAQKLIHMHPSDVVSSHTFCLPQASKLQQTLKPIADNILKLLRKLRKTKRRSPEDVSKNRSRAATAPDRIVTAMSPVDSGDSDKDSDTAELLQPPLQKSVGKDVEEIVPDSIASSPLLTQNISKFADAVKTHLQTLVNTAIEINWEKKMQRQQAKEDLKNAPKEREIHRAPSDVSLASISDASMFSQDLPDPHLDSDPAPVFPRQLIGSSAYSFIGMFSKTQLFCEYCERHRSTNAAIGDIVNTDSGRHYEETKTAEFSPVEPPIDTSQFDDGVEVGSAVQYDPLVMLFSIILSGTCPLSENKVSTLMDTLDSLYGNCPALSGDTRAQELRAQWESKRRSTTVTRSGDDADIVDAFTQAPLASTDHLQSTVDMSEESLWCNGRCNGMANTPSCTGICIDIWQARVQNLKKQKRAVDLIRHDSTILAPGSFVRGEDGGMVRIPSSVKLSSGKRLKVGSVRGMQPRKHPKETSSQYLHRVALVTGRDQQSVAADVEVVNAILGAGEIHLDGNQSMPWNPQEVLEKTCSYTYIERSRDAKGKSNRRRSSGALNAIIRHRQKQKRICAQKQRLRAARVLYRFFLHARQRQIYLVRVYAATIIQRHIRGYIVRSNMDVIVASLIARKRENKKKKARGVLKNWIQKSINAKREEGGTFETENEPDNNIHTDTGTMAPPKNPVKQEVQRSGSGAMKVFDNVPLSGVEENDPDDRRQSRTRARSEDLAARSYSSGGEVPNKLSSPPDVRRSQSLQPSSLSPTGGRHKALLGGLIPAYPQHDVSDVNLHAPVSTRTRSFIITEALRRREMRMQQAAGGGKTGDKVFGSADDGEYDSADECFSPTRSLDSPLMAGILRSDSKDSVGSEDAATGSGKESNSGPTKKLPGSDNSSRKLDLVGLGSIAEESSVIKGHRTQFSDSTLSADSTGSDDNLRELPLCIQNLGTAGQDLLNNVQQQCIIDMCNILRHGILVLKHGRSGKPKLRTLCCDEALTILYWREVGQVVSDDRSANSVEAGGNFALPDKSPFHNSFMDHPKKIVARRRSSFSVFSKQDSRREVVLRDVIEVRDDMTTDVMKRSISKRYVEDNRSPSLVISIILRDRTLDFEIEEIHWGPVFMALQILVDFYQTRSHIK